MTRLLPLVLGAALFGCGPKAPPPAPEPSAELAVFTDQLGSRWYGLYRDGHKVGWLRSTFGEDLFRGESVLVAEGRAEITTRGAGALHQTVRTTRHVFEASAPHDLLRYRTETLRDGRSEWRELRRGPGGSGWVLAEGRDGAREEVRPTNLSEYTLAGFLGMERWVAEAPGLGDVRAVERLDGTGSGVVRAEAQVVGVLHTVLDAVPTTVTSVATTEPGGGVVVTRYDHEGRILGTTGGAVELRLESEASAKELDAPVDLFLDSLVRVQGAVPPGPRTRLVLEVPEGVTSLLPAGSGQRLGPRTVELTREGATVHVEDAERAEALVETAAYPKDDGAVLTLLRRAKPTRANRLDTVRALTTFVRDYLEDDRTAEPLGVQAVIEQRRGDCTEHAALFVTLARAAGIPAREVGGLLWVERLDAFGGHAWAEVEIGGVWVPVDPTWGEVPADARHLRLPAAPQVEAAVRRRLVQGPVVLVEAE